MYHTSQEISSNRVRTTYYTRKSLTAVPIGNILHPENNVSDYTVTVDGYNDNVVYSKYYPTAPDGGYWQEKFVHNPEGMTRHYSYEEHYPFYFIKDHLGNTSTYRRRTTASGEVLSPKGNDYFLSLKGTIISSSNRL